MPPGSPNPDPMSVQKMTFSHPFSDLGSIVPKVDNAIHWINLYPLDNAIGFLNIYPLDSNLSGG